MRDNPRDWRIEDIKMIAQKHNIQFHQPASSHVTFRFSNGKKVTIPAHKPIKAVYVKEFIRLFDELGGSL